MKQEQVVQIIVDEIQKLKERKKQIIKATNIENKEQNKYVYLLEGRNEGRLCEIDGNIIFLLSLLDVLDS